MSVNHRILRIAPIILLMSCAKAQGLAPDGGGSGSIDSGIPADASCGNFCDHDGDGVVDGSDACPNTATGATVNNVGCADSQLSWKLEPSFPPYDLAWTPTGELGRAGGLTWTYINIQRKDLFHIAWIICDDPALPCGLSLDGPIDVPAENWTFSSIDSDPANGKLIFYNATHILLADTTMPALTGRLTITIVDASDVPIHFADVTALGNVTSRMGTYGAEIMGTGFKVVALAEVQATMPTWTPYQDYYDAASTPVAGGGSTISFGGSFYDK